jgi:DNA-binding transcriptional LysR family regulator
MRYRQLEAFRAVMLAGSVTQAAEMLSISQPAVSRLISCLEQDMGFPLFRRRRGRLQPTPEAQFLLGEVERAIANLDHVAQIVEDIRNRRSGHLRIACLPGFATSLLPRVIAQFLTQRPGTTISFQPRSSQRVQEWIMAQQYDVGFGEIPPEHPAIEHESVHVRCVCVLPEDHPLTAKPVITMADLDDVPLVSLNRDHTHTRKLREVFDRAGARFNMRVETHQFAPACIMVAGGVGAAIVSPIDAAEYAERGVAIRPFEPTIGFGLGILYPAYRPRSLILSEFVELFQASLEPFLMETPAAPSESTA